MRLALGYVPLVDAASLIAAAELGFARAEGLTLDLVREPSWATLRDKLAVGHLDGAHILAPLAIASTLGLSGPQTRLCVPMALNLNGNAVTVSRPLWDAMEAADDEVDTVAAAFARIARRRAREGRPLTLGTVHPFSSHTYQLRIFAERGGLDLDTDTRLVVIPPPQIAEALRRELVDGFCVGSPWNSVAVAEGYGRIAVLCSELVPGCPEKVLALPESEAPRCAPLVRALDRAGRWCADPGNGVELAALLAREAYLGTSAPILARAITGDVVVDPGGRRRRDPHFALFGEAAHRPDPAHADWFIDQAQRAGQLASSDDLLADARAVYRPDLFDAALSG
ncbi:CmpA/NrtA family ABC transporter substrate-binding protein [Methylobacterium sp. E-045]|uniref:CmpA/NrtA family ABC transporter substrate-binding protein n=1 Tax=Methylobacterium sp. E-045 TaxID=2836575 RepID=UPI001FBA7AF8|nr:CmpA/NrtA family ABC transporter substrate-binding protein [Methylobacterium sp. E-045]MCJ2130278.1 ABC transporter substrate-binding protein [Methylobacterium sp. E-045]